MGLIFWVWEWRIGDKAQVMGVIVVDKRGQCGTTLLWLEKKMVKRYLPFIFLATVIYNCVGQVVVHIDTRNTQAEYLIVRCFSFDGTENRASRPVTPGGTMEYLCDNDHSDQHYKKVSDIIRKIEVSDVTGQIFENIEGSALDNRLIEVVYDPGENDYRYKLDI